jgi:hypothetical protein
MRLLDENLHVVERAVLGMDAGVLGDVITVVEPWRRVERQQPERVDAELGDVVELRPGKSPMPSLLASKNDFTCS